MTRNIAIVSAFAALTALAGCGQAAPEYFTVRPGFACKVLTPNGYERDCVAKGWLRASHRELDRSRSTPLRPWHSHTRIQKLGRGEAVPLDIEIWPSATLFEAKSTLQLIVHGHDAARYPGFGHRKLVNRGWHTIFTGGRYDSCLAVPLNEATEILLARK